MRNKHMLKIVVLVLMSLNLTVSAGEDKYSELAIEISNAAGQSLVGKKIAIIPFSYADAREGTTDGSIVSERLTMKMINLNKFEIIERSVLDKVMNELKLQSSGIMDANSTKELGKVLGVDAIITGTLVERTGGKIEVNARLIKTETARAIGAAQIIIEKDWMGGDQSIAQPVQKAVYQPKTQAAPTKTYAKGANEYSFFDLFVGFGAPNIILEFANPLGNISLDTTYTNDLGVAIYAGGTGDYKSVKWTNLLSEGTGPVAMRVGGFGKGNIGGAMELSLEKRNIKAQDAKWSLNSGPERNFTFLVDDYLTVISFGISGDIYIRHVGKKVDPYIGMGLGLSLNSITLPYVKGFTASSTPSRPVEQMGVGLIFRLPIGMRIRLDKKNQIVTELRYEMNSIGFDRDIKSEEDRIVIHGVKFLIGMGFGF
ncbi:MAG: CsgG/HfaB family protein [Elusimicrobia bacterium]|nr:CsgG/HfaB family protein [Elusimicrobiota bacterium]